MIGAQIPEIWFEKLMIPPTLPTSLRRAIMDGSDQPTGEAARIKDRAQRWQAAAKKGHVGSMLIGSGQPKALELMAEIML